MCAASVGPSSLNSLQILIPFINLYWVLAARGWQQCRNPNFSPLSFSLICNTTNNHILCERHFLIQGVGRWFHRFRMFETGFCPDCVRFLPFRSPQTKGHMLYKTSQELRMLSRSPSDCRSLLLNLNLSLNRCLCSDCSDCSAIVVLL